MHFNSDEILFRCLLCHGQQGLAITKANFQQGGGAAAEAGIEVQRGVCHFQPVIRPVLFQSPRLPFGQTPFPPHKTADASQTMFRHDQKKVPSMGEEALAYIFRGMRPARKASRPASMAFFMADAISTGF